MNKYIPTIGIEVHVELKTNSKIFSSSKAGYDKSANTNINEIDLGYPGTLPNLNEEVVNLAIKAALILNCKINKIMHFDRKNYFYPDNSKNYQITQNKTPIGYDGYVEIEIDGKLKKIYIEEMHIEEDTAKSTHMKDKTLLDFNRAGVGLIEIVTKPCIDTPQEAKLYLEKLKELLFYTDISDCKMEEGSMRADANISLRKSDDSKLGVKVEIKNLGSISNLKLSLEKEIKRQSDILDKGEVLKPQTRRFDQKINDTVLMRYKETGNDYRYFPEPDIPFVIINDERIEAVKKNIPMLPDERSKKYLELGVSAINVSKLISNRELSDFFNTLLDSNINYQTAANLLLGDISAYLNKEEMTFNNINLSKGRFIDLINKFDNKELTNKNFKDILVDFLTSDKKIDDLLKNIINIDDEEELGKIIDDVIKNNNNSVIDYKNGHDRAIKFLMGQIMKETKGSANPVIAMELLKNKLDN